MSEAHILDRMGYARRLETTSDRLMLEMDNRPDLANVRGALQGGLVATLIDIAAGHAGGQRHAASAHDVTTADHQHPLPGADHGRPARAEARIVRAGKRLIVTSVDVTDVTRDRLAARATLTFAVLEPR